MAVSGGCRKVMVVEDDPDLRHLLTFLLQSEGYEVVEAADGAQAMARLREAEEPGLILLDLMMPTMNGWEFRREQQKDPELASIPVVILSAVGNLWARAATLKAADYIEKPVDLDRLITVVGQHCTTH